MIEPLPQPVRSLFDLAASGRIRAAIDLALENLTGGMSLDELVTQVLAPLQRHVGLLWEENRWNVAEEHAATAVVDGVLGAAALQVRPREQSRGRVLVACAEGEHHTMPPRMGSELLRAAGWDVVFLGGSLPATDLQRFAARQEPDAVLISCTVPLFLGGARRCFTAVAELGLPALAVGRAFGGDDRRARKLGARGWLAPSADLGSLLATGLEDDPRPWRPSAEAIALELDADDLTRRCLAEMSEHLPQMANYSPAQLESTRTDVGYILSYLAVALDLDDATIFGDFVTWLRGVLARRGVPAVVLDRSLSLVAEVVAAAGLPGAAALCSADVRESEG